MVFTLDFLFTFRTNTSIMAQIDLKKLLRSPPLVKIPRGPDLISLNRLLGTLPPTVGELLVGSTKETMKLRGATLYSEGSKPNGVWLILNGVAKWASKSIRNKHSLHPTFTHGSSLGLYEVLNGRPRICDMITDSVVLCFFIEAEKILAVLSSDPAIEDFLWQESATVLAKLLLPQIFEKMPMQEVRALVAEKSTTNTYLRGETVKLPYRFIGLLLEGYIKTQRNQEELITSPAALFPWYGHMSFQGSDASGIKSTSFLHQASYYQVETRARVIMLDIAGFEANRVLQRSSSLISQTKDHPARSIISKEHIGLMSWPEQQANNTRRPAQSSPRNKERPLHSLSYPRFSPPERQPLIHAKSEGDVTLWKTVGVQIHKAPSSKPPVPSSSTIGDHGLNYSTDRLWC